MRISTKGRFAINALIDLALRQRAGPVSLATVSARQKVSLSYLEQLFSRLRRDGIVDSTRGPGGGYTLGRPAVAISVADVVLAVEDPLDDAEAAADGLSCGLWQRLNAGLVAQMATITLQSLVDEQGASALPVDPPAPRRGIAPRPLAASVGAVASALTRGVPNSVFALGGTFARG